MDFSGPLGAYPPPNSFTWKHGVFDATRPLNVALGPGIGAWTTECISDALASVGAKPSVSREETPTHLSWLSLTDSAGKHAAPPDLEFKGIGSESYELNVSSDGITLVARSPRGLSYGVDTLVRMVRDTGGRLPAVSVADGPSCEVRGVHLFLPGRSDLEFFIRLMEFLARHRYNTIFLETAAGMEFRTASRDQPRVGRVRQRADGSCVRAEGASGEPVVRLEERPARRTGRWLVAHERRDAQDRRRRANLRHRDHPGGPIAGACVLPHHGTPRDRRGARRSVARFILPFEPAKLRAAVRRDGRGDRGCSSHAQSISVTTRRTPSVGAGSAVKRPPRSCSPET